MASMSGLPPIFLRSIDAEFSPDFLTQDPAARAIYGRDWTRVVDPAATAVAFPRTTQEVSAFLTLCHTHRVAVVPSGGRTGLAGGAVAAQGEVVLSLERMRKINEVDVLGQTVRVQAGAITEAVHLHCAKHGLIWPVDFASKGSSQVGGNIATNAGGVRVIRYGLTRQWVLGLQVVLADGSVLELNGALEKNNTGPDLRQLFIGSEGVLGVVTEATLKLCRLPHDEHVMLFALPSLAHVLQLFRHARKAPFTLCAYEFFTDLCMHRLHRHRGLRVPFEVEHPVYVLVELEAKAASEVEAWVASVFETGLATDGVLANTQTQAAQLWALREGISESLSATGLPHKNDVALPIRELESFCGSLANFFEEHYPGWEICIFGHIGDGNLHINVMQPDGLDKTIFLQRTKKVDHDIFGLVQKHQGSVSAEHGIGLLKKDYLRYVRTPTEIAMFRGLKHLLDPHGILNPGKIF